MQALPVFMNLILRVPFNLDTLASSGNTFRLEISDTTGSFASPQLLATLNSNHSDTINANIAFAGLFTNKTYQVRIVANSPQDTSINTATVRIRTLPDNFSIAGAMPICAGTPSKFFASNNQSGVIYNWQLTFGNAALNPQADTLFVTPSTAGSISLSLAATNVCGTVTSSRVGITVLPPPPTAKPSLTKRGRWLDATNPLPVGGSGYRWYRNDTLISSATASSYYASS
ncbi:MAG: hypothetical protein EON98_09675, partial [Chitinophagaceae bacterium]